MKTDNIIQHKSYSFAVGLVRFIRGLDASPTDLSLYRQLLRSATSIGANVEEAIAGQSYADFSHKLRIAYSEARETMYWLRLLHDAGVYPDQTQRFAEQAEELCRILGAITKTNKSNGVRTKSKPRDSND